MKILLEVPIGMSAGYSKDGVGLSRALVERGHQVTLIPTGLQVPIPTDIANLLSVEHYQDPPYDIRITHQAPQDVQLSAEDAAQAKTNIYWTMWEWQNYPIEFVPRFTAGTSNYDYFVAYDEGSMAALAPHLTLDPEKMVVVQGGYESEDWRMPFSPPSEDAPFLFGMVGDISPRKNPLALIEGYRGFRDQYPDRETGLIIKSRFPFLGHAYGPYSDPEWNIQEIVGVWSREELELFYHALGAYVAPSYGEGKNLPALEAATCGVPLILSDIPGHRQWASGLPSAKFVSGTTSGLRLEGLPVWGLKVDPAQLTQAMIDIYENRTHYWNEARSTMPSVVMSMDWYRVVERLGKRLDIPWL